MSFINIFVVYFLCFNYLATSQAYKAAVIHERNNEIDSFVSLIYEAGTQDVDILVLPSLETAFEKYDDTVKFISKGAKEANLYIVTHLYEKTRCQMGHEIVRNNLVFDREGVVVAVHRKPLNSKSNCTATSSDLVTFTTDFGIKFGLLMEEDIVLQDLEYMRGLKNFVMSGGSHSKLPFLSVAEFASSWTYVTNANLISSAGIYSGKAGLRSGPEEMTVIELQNIAENYPTTVPSVIPKDSANQDLSQHAIRSLDLKASSKGVKESVCHGSFCCDFYVKTVGEGSTDVNYGLSSFNGIYQINGHHNIGVQSCTFFVCTEKNCEFSSQNFSNIMFEKISITANFTNQGMQFPILQTASVVPSENFKFDTEANVARQVTVEIVDGRNVASFGIFGRDFNKDFQTNFDHAENRTVISNDIYDYIYNEDVQEFFDYVWIRLRVLLVVVSIYILEMM